MGRKQKLQNMSFFHYSTTFVKVVCFLSRILMLSLKQTLSDASSVAANECFESFVTKGGNALKTIALSPFAKMFSTQFNYYTFIYRDLSYYLLPMCFSKSSAAILLYELEPIFTCRPILMYHI